MSEIKTISAKTVSSGKIMSSGRRSSKSVRTIAAILLLLPTLAAYAGPPPETLAAFDAALGLLEKSDVPVSYVTSTVFSIADGSGKTLQTIETVEKVVLEPGKKPVRETVSRKTSGGDTDAVSGASRSGSEGTSSWRIVLPTGKDRESFVFSEPVPDGKLLYSEFGPGAKTAAREGMTKGRLYWDGSTGKPVSADIAPVKDPPFTSGLSFSFDFLEKNGFSYPAIIRFSGEGGFLFFRRKINSISRVTGFERDE